MPPVQLERLTEGSFSDKLVPSSAAVDRRAAAFAEEGRAPVSCETTHLFEAEGHGEHADAHDAVHHVHDEAGVGRRHCEAAVVPRK